MPYRNSCWTKNLSQSCVSDAITNFYFRIVSFSEREEVGVAHRGYGGAYQKMLQNCCTSSQICTILYFVADCTSHWYSCCIWLSVIVEYRCYMTFNQVALGSSPSRPTSHVSGLKAWDIVWQNKISQFCHIKSQQFLYKFPFSLSSVYRLDCSSCDSVLHQESLKYNRSVRV